MRGMLVVALVACGPSAAEIRTIKTTTYTNPERVLVLAEQAATDDEHYKIAAQQDLQFETEPRFYSPEGDLQSQGAGGYVKVDNHSVKVSFVVELVESDHGQYLVTVTPRTWQYIAGSPQMRELRPDDPYLPSFVLGRADALAIAIHDRAKGYAFSAPGH